jgi:hypothetical protein
LIVASTRNVESAVHEIREWADSKWAVAIKPLMPFDMPPDHPDLEPIWRAAAEHDLAIAHHSSTWNPPYYPAYRDVWDNIFLGRLASHPWGSWQGACRNPVDGRVTPGLAPTDRCKRGPGAAKTIG